MMPDKPLTIATYAAGASLAAITLFYVFGPTFFLDDDASNSSGRKQVVVGLSNPANDCFINSVLQALAGLGDLRVYLIRELHRRELDGPDIYKVNPQSRDVGNEKAQLRKLDGLQQGLVTKALKDILDKLNERPIHRKTISAGTFISVLEYAFNTRISRNQQDAQEFLQVVAERLCDEYHAGQRARLKARQSQKYVVAKDEEGQRDSGIALDVPERYEGERQALSSEPSGRRLEESTGDEKSDHKTAAEEGFPMEGTLESQIECLTCHFKPEPSVSSFVTLTLNVPQEPSTSLGSCFDGIFKVEHIDDYKCDQCRLEHALQYKLKELSAVTAADHRSRLEVEIHKIREAIHTDPEEPPDGVRLPDIKLAPKRRITKHMRISTFPKTMAIHLSRSIFGSSSVSTKNMAKVSFPEILPLGGLLEQRKYKLLCVVTHKGGHNSGHYETLRRQVVPAPYSTPNAFSNNGVYSLAPSAAPSASPSPRLLPSKIDGSSEAEDSAHPPPPSDRPVTMASGSSTSSLPSSNRGRQGSNFSRSSWHATPSAPSVLRGVSSSGASSKLDGSRLKRKARKLNDRWWRISDDKVKESKTSEVLSMQKDVYLLFYELERQQGGTG